MVSFNFYPEKSAIPGEECTVVVWGTATHIRETQNKLGTAYPKPAPVPGTSCTSNASQGNWQFVLLLIFRLGEYVKFLLSNDQKCKAWTDFILASEKQIQVIL